MLIIAVLPMMALLAEGKNMAENPSFAIASEGSAGPAGYALEGAAKYEFAGYRDEFSSKGIVFDSYQAAGTVSQTVPVDPKQGRWLTFRIRARAEDGFAVQQDQLYLEMAFFGDHGKRYQDKVKRLIYREITRDRKDFAVNGDNHKSGAAAWRSYELEELLPFAETDAVKFSVGFEGGSGTGQPYDRFMISEFDVQQHQNSTEGKEDPAARIGSQSKAKPSSTAGMISLGGRWYYKPSAGESISLNSDGKLADRLMVTEKNSSQLFYKDDQLENPFEGNMTAWLRKGFLDEDGQMVKEDRFIPDNVTVEFDGSKYFTIHARNIPNHPTAIFPDTYGSQGYNPNYIQEHNYAWKLPLEPKLLTDPLPVDPKNTEWRCRWARPGSPSMEWPSTIPSTRECRMRRGSWTGAVAIRAPTTATIITNIRSA